MGSSEYNCILLVILSCCVLDTLGRSRTSRTYRSTPWLKMYCANQNTGFETCEEGEFQGPCGQVCKKGPGDICGGAGDQYGVCGDGLSCSSCNLCTGCSYKSFSCYDDSECLSDDNIWLTAAYWLGLETLILIT
eukprot:GFUD01010457.1.p1 GENE.GFUD01010457.1~~GFUD01010457.1.p1  ORF type:complete len:134 (+),score=32.05 GFUD01010457.1:73-474(+)